MGSVIEELLRSEMAAHLVTNKALLRAETSLAAYAAAEATCDEEIWRTQYVKTAQRNLKKQRTLRTLQSSCRPRHLSRRWYHRLQSSRRLLRPLSCTPKETSSTAPPCKHRSVKEQHRVESNLSPLWPMPWRVRTSTLLIYHRKLLWAR